MANDNGGDADEPGGKEAGMKPEEMKPAEMKSASLRAAAPREPLVIEGKAEELSPPVPADMPASAAWEAAETPADAVAAMAGRAGEEAARPASASVHAVPNNESPEAQHAPAHREIEANADARDGVQDDAQDELSDAQDDLDDVPSRPRRRWRSLSAALLVLVLGAAAIFAAASADKKNLLPDFAHLRALLKKNSDPKSPPVQTASTETPSAPDRGEAAKPAAQSAGQSQPAPGSAGQVSAPQSEPPAVRASPAPSTAASAGDNPIAAELPAAPAPVAAAPVTPSPAAAESPDQTSPSALAASPPAAISQPPSRQEPAAAVAPAAQSGSPLPSDEQLAAVDQKLGALQSQLAAQAADQASAVRAAVAAPLAALAVQTSRVNALEQKLASAETRLADLDAKLAAPKTDVRASEDLAASGSPGSLAARAVVAQALIAAAQSGAPFKDDLEALRGLGVSAEKLAPLEASAAPGVPTVAALRAQFASVRPKLNPAPAPSPAAAGQSFGDRVMGQLTSLVKVRPAGETSGPSADAVASRIDGALSRGDVAGAMMEYEALPESAKAAAKDWQAAASARQQVLAGAQALLRDSITSLGKPKS